MDSGRLALLEKAREFGSLAQTMTFQDFLDKSVTYRTLALYLGVEALWWSEFWRSFSFYASKSPKARAAIDRIFPRCFSDEPSNVKSE